MNDPGAMSAADASTIIIEGVRRGQWRILIGEDAEFLDALIRSDPEAAPTPAFFEQVTAAGFWANSLSQKALAIRDEAVAAAAKVDSVMRSFEGALAIVTGGGAGMGRDLCTQLAAKGAHIAICDMSEDAMAETKALCQAANSSVTVSTFSCDVSDEAQCQVGSPCLYFFCDFQWENAFFVHFN